MRPRVLARSLTPIPSLPLTLSLFFFLFFIFLPGLGRFREHLAPRFTILCALLGRPGFRQHVFDSTLVGRGKH